MIESQHINIHEKYESSLVMSLRRGSRDERPGHELFQFLLFLPVCWLLLKRNIVEQIVVAVVDGLV